jgi:cell division protein FtsZ
VIDESMNDEVRVTVIATGFDHGSGRGPSSSRASVPSRSGRRDRDVTMDDRQRSSLEIRDDEIDIPSFLKDR